MSASYWSSTQRRFWTYTKPELAQIRRSLEDENKELVQKYPLPDRRLLHVYVCSQLNKLVRRLKLSQQAVATAQVYIRRVYTKIEIRRTNPNLVIVTALYLACKMEESPQHIRMILGEARQAWQGKYQLITIAGLGECEFSLISEMNSQLIIHHPYRSMLDLQTSFELTPEEYSQAEYVLNDHYLTDLPLLHPPHLIAIAAMVIAVTLGPTQAGMKMLTAANMQIAMSNISSPQAGNSSVDIEAVADCVQEMISLYEVWEQYNEKVCKDQINRFIKARGLEK
ncbi:RNA polymerase ii holoenzyme cyclin-like subunit [Neofusicoccum parvum]|uniref:RNA polymerase ii holoenzyme cyclin-like subunit n=1 Tax=Neofusicoccum parvum TaxID=310453 RepID=A0ACB5RRH3_9PEZI|nr:RNA polymerase ii holoenzyme cyclin-like subunit [Neofusicoccum parvum]